MASGRRVLLPVVTLALVLALPSRSEAGDGDGVVVKDKASVLSSARKAIASHLGGVFVVRIEGTSRLHRWAVWHIFTVEDVLKPYRNDEGAYYVPLTINERTPNDGKPRLQVGERYLLVTLLERAAWSPLYVQKALRLGATGNARLLEEIRAETKKHAVYGSSDYLRREQGGEREVLETSGVQTPHADGYVDPEPFGVTRKGVREAVEAGMDVLLVRFVDSRRARLISQEFLVEVVEDLAGRRVTRPLWVRRPEKNEEWFARSKKMLAPYKLPDVLPHRRYVIVVDPRADGLPAMKSIVPAIHDDGPTVRKIRSWVQDGAKGGGKPAAKPGEATPRAQGAGPAAADRLSRELLDSWMMRQYDLARAGVKEASCKVRATIGEPTGRTAKATGEYRWDGECGFLTWDNKQVARILARQGWSAEKLDMWFKADRRVVLDGTRLSAKKSGSGAVIRVEGGDLKEIRFDGDGVLTTVVSTVSGDPVESTLTFDYKRVGDLYVWSGWSMELTATGVKYVETNTIKTAKMGGFLVMTNLAARSTVGSPPNQMELRKVLTFSDWKINGRAVAADGAVEKGGNERHGGR